MNWTKQGVDWVCHVPPALFTMKVSPKGDGRWSWQVFAGANPNPTATGITSSLGAAKNVSEQFVKRSGLV
jgi:hypothetical protein